MMKVRGGGLRAPRGTGDGVVMTGRGGGGVKRVKGWLLGRGSAGLHYSPSLASLFGVGGRGVSVPANPGNSRCLMEAGWGKGWGWGVWAGWGGGSPDADSRMGREMTPYLICETNGA